MDNVIKFPKNNINPSFVPNDLNEIDERMQMIKFQHIIETLETILPTLFQQIELAGFNINDEEDISIKDGAFVIEAIRSFLCKTHGIDHPFQTIAEEVFERTSDTTFRIIDKLNVTLKEDMMEKGTS